MKLKHILFHVSSVLTYCGQLSIIIIALGLLLSSVIFLTIGCVCLSELNTKDHNPEYSSPSKCPNRALSILLLVLGCLFMVLCCIGTTIKCKFPCGEIEPPEKYQNVNTLIYDEPNGNNVNLL
jgi:hypothetical protein